MKASRDRPQAGEAAVPGKAKGKRLSKAERALIRDVLGWRERYDDRPTRDRAGAAPAATAPRVLAAEASALIVRHESGGRAYYEQVIKKRPIWPEFSSGLTIGFGFDIGHRSKAELERVWTPHLGAEAVARLARAVGLTATGADREAKVARLKKLAKELADIEVPWSMAEAVFAAEEVPIQVAKTTAALPNTELLGDTCLGALVSLVFNRGSGGFTSSKTRFREMRAIRQHMADRNFAAIPAEIRSMCRLWPDHPGLTGRREEEAALFEAGLASLPATAAARPAPAWPALVASLDAAPDRFDTRDLPYRPPLVSLPPSWPPALWIERFLPQYAADGMVLDQRAEGACTGFGLAAVINYIAWEAWQRATIEERPAPAPVKVSERMLYHMAQLYDEWEGEDYEGSSCRGAMKGWHKHGVCAGHLWPYEDGSFVGPDPTWASDAALRPIGAYYRIDRSSLVDLQAAIAEVHAIYVSAQVHGGWNLGPAADAPPVIDWNGEAAAGAHAFALVGYDERGFIVQNSWGPDWGFGGFAILTYGDWLAHGHDAWVAVLGAPIGRTTSPVALSEAPLQARAATLAGAGAGRADSAAPPAAAPWAADTALERTLVLGNDGRPLHRLLTARDAAANLACVVEEHLLRRLRDSGSRKLVVYAHGGLNDEPASLLRVRRLGPYFEANGVPALFFTWRTGVRDCLLGILEDAASRVGIDLALVRAEGLARGLKEELAETRDATLEVLSERLLGKAVWTQMKQNAAAASEPAGGAALAARSLARLAGEIEGLEIHLIGHSAGAIFHGHLLRRLAAEGLAVKSAELWAPACSLRFAVERYGRAFAEGTLAPKALHIALLADVIERADSVGPYGKSLLYLVSRAFEPLRRMPLLGLADAWTGDVPVAARPFNSAARADIEAWRALWRGRLELVSEPEVGDGRKTIPAVHGSFDNNAALVSATIRRIRGQKLALPVGDLGGF
jgi:GH24 family phage-related lysozyme (muramidase)